MTEKQKNIRTKKRKNRRLVLLFFGSSVLWFLLFSFVSAQIDFSPGYTLRSADQQVEITAAPNTLNRTVYFDLQTITDYPAIPLDKILGSQVYSYALLPASNNRLDYPVTVSAAYEASQTGFKEIFVYNFSSAKWKHLAGEIDLNANRLTAQTTLASGLLAVLADKLERSEYLKEELNSPTILVAEAESGEILLERGSDIKRPVASLTKLMTAAVFLDNNPGWNKMITMLKSDDTIPAKIYVKTGDKISTRDLFFAALVHSANNAARALARSTGLSKAEFVRQMNAKAQALGMTDTRFVEPTGLSVGNVSTAQDYFQLAQHLLPNDLFRQATTLKKYRLTLKRGRKTIKLTTVNNNKLLDSPYLITGTKTGYTREAGRCLLIRAKGAAGREVIAVIMGATIAGKQWSDMNSLLAAALGDKDNYAIASSQ